MGVEFALFPVPPTASLILDMGSLLLGATIGPSSSITCTWTLSWFPVLARLCPSARVESNQSYWKQNN